MKKNKTATEVMNETPSNLQRLVRNFEELTQDLRSLDESDKEERQLVEDSRAKLQELQEQVNAILQGNERARRERLVKLSNLQELLRPILFPMIENTKCCEAQQERLPFLNTNH